MCCFLGDSWCGVVGDTGQTGDRAARLPGTASDLGYASILDTASIRSELADRTIAGISRQLTSASAREGTPLFPRRVGYFDYIENQELLSRPVVGITRLLTPQASKSF